jgi:hypothetical protein
MVGAVRLEALGVFGRIALAAIEESVRALGANPERAGDALRVPLHLADNQAVDLPLGDSRITFTGAPAGGLLIDAPPGLGLAVALGGGSVQLSDHRSRWTLKPGDYGPVRIKGVNVSIEVLQ